MNALAAQQDKLIGIAEQAEKYFTLLDKQHPTPAEELRIKIYKTVLESHNIQSRSDYDYLKNVVSETAQKSAPLKEKFEWCRQLYEQYSDIAKTYYDILQGDYISQIIENRHKVDETARPRKLKQ